jgi:hypothetical protein
MADSHKISLLDLQAPDLSQYGKKNRDLNRGATRSTDSSYRKQLSESLSKKQTSSSTEKASERESRSADLKSDQARTKSNTPEARSTSESRQDQAAAESQQRNISRDETTSVSEESRVTDSRTEKTVTDQEQKLQGNSETIETTEEVINPQPANNLPTKDKEQNYSLFNTAFAVQNEGAFDQEVTTADSEVQPPANFQLVDDQSLVNLQTDVTETGLDQAIPIPEGLADQLNKQFVETSQTDSGQEVADVDVPSFNQELNTANQLDSSLTEQAESENQSSEQN